MAGRKPDWIWRELMKGARKLVLARRWKRFLHENSGATPVEYALCLAMIVGGLLVTTELVGVGMSHVFEKVARVAGPAERVASPAGVAADTAGVPAIVIQPESDFNLTTIGMMMAVAVICGYALAIGRVRKKEVEPDPDDTGAETCESALFQKRQIIRQRLLNHADVFLSGQLVARHIMSQAPVTVLPTTDVAEIEEIFATRNIRHVLVCDGHGKLLGTVSDRHLKKAQNKNLLAASVMTAPDAVEFTTPLTQVISMALQRRVSCIAVLREGRLQGVLTASDVMMTMQCALQLLPAIGNSPLHDEFVKILTGESDGQG